MDNNTQVLFYWLNKTDYANATAVEAKVKELEAGSVAFAEANTTIYVGDTKFGIDPTSFAQIAANKANITSLSTTVDGLRFFAKITGDEGEMVGAAYPGANLPIKGDDASGIVTTASTAGVKISLTVASGTTAGTIKFGTTSIQVQGWDKMATKAEVSSARSEVLGTDKDASTANTVYGAKKAAAEALTAANTAKSTADGKVASVTAPANAGINIGGTATAPTVGIKIDTTTAGNVTLSTGANGLKADVVIPAATVKSVKTGDKVLALTGTELSTTVGLTYDPTAKKIKLTGIGNAEIASIDATQFIKDGMISAAELISTVESGVTGIEAPYIKITFNTDAGQEPIRFSVKELVDVYTGANVKLASVSTANTYDAPKAGDSVDVAMGKLIKGIADAKTSGVTSFGTKTGAITLKASDSANGTVNLTMTNNELAAAIVGLGTAAYTNSTAYATAAQGTKADNALQTVSASGSNYITASAAPKASNAQAITVSATVQAMETATSSAKGLAEASDVKSYVDSKVATAIVWQVL